MVIIHLSLFLFLCLIFIFIIMFFISIYFHFKFYFLYLGNTESCMIPTIVTWFENRGLRKDKIEEREKEKEEQEEVKEAESNNEPLRWKVLKVFCGGSHTAALAVKN